MKITPDVMGTKYESVKKAVKSRNIKKNSRSAFPLICSVHTPVCRTIVVQIRSQTAIVLLFTSKPFRLLFTFMGIRVETCRSA